MNEPFEALIATLQQEHGAIHSCECMYMAHEISEDLGDFVRGLPLASYRRGRRGCTALCVLRGPMLVDWNPELFQKLPRFSSVGGGLLSQGRSAWQLAQFAL